MFQVLNREMKFVALSSNEISAQIQFAIILNTEFIFKEKRRKDRKMQRKMCNFHTKAFHFCERNPHSEVAN